MLGRKLNKERKWKKIGQCGRVRGKIKWENGVENGVKNALTKRIENGMEK